MNLPALRSRSSQSLLSFAWNEWAQMGVLAAAGRQSRWAQDPEALLAFTFELARDDPRLFDEVLDWLALNQGMVSVRRLRTLGRLGGDARIVEAVIDSIKPRKPRFPAQVDQPVSPAQLVPLFPGRMPSKLVDPTFADHGFARSAPIPSDKAQAPDLRTPINFAFRLRELLGIGARAEVVRLMLTAGSVRLTAQDAARSAAYAKRNVHEALTSLERAGVIYSAPGSGGQRFGIELDRWAALLQMPGGSFPAHRDWPQLLSAASAVHRWLHRPELEELSPYLQASQARELLLRVERDVRYGGVAVEVGATVETAWDDVARLLEALTQSLETAAHDG